MAIVDLTGWSSFTQSSFRPVAHSRGYSSELSGASAYAVAHGGHWAGVMTIPAMCWQDAKALRAAISAADGRAGVCLVYPDRLIPDNRLTRYTDGTAFSDVTEFSDELTAFAGSVTVTASASRAAQVDGLRIEKPSDFSVSEIVGLVLGVGDPYGDAGDYQAMQIISATTVSGDTTDVGVRPRLRRAISSGDPVFIGSPPLRMRFVDDDPGAALVVSRGVLLPTTLEMVEAD